MSQWSLASLIESHLYKINNQLTHDQELREAFSSTATGDEFKDFAFAIVASPVSTTSDSPPSEHHSINVRLQNAYSGAELFNVSVTPGATSGQNASTNSAISFSLNAKDEHWQNFFQEDLTKITRPHQSYWGMLRILGSDNGVFISGDTATFARFARVWRITLDRIRLVVAGQVYDNSMPGHNETDNNNEDDGDNDIEDAITGKYTWITHTQYGKVKIFYEFSGTGPQNLLFLHTAGSDSRQYHSLMNDVGLREKCTMYAFDLPGHGRSSLGTKQSIDNYALTEESYIESIEKVVQKIGRIRQGQGQGQGQSDNDKEGAGLKDLIVCGASMAGHICLALAIRAPALTIDIRGSIPCEGCAHLPTPAAIYTLGSTSSPPSILDPEKVCGMISPTSPEYFKRQIWWQYSSQANGIFTGDLKFYFKGWDGRDRLSGIDTGLCPVYMLTGEYDYSCTVEASRETAEGIEGAVRFESMPGLGHFPLTEDPAKVLPYLGRAIEFIQRNRKG